MAVPKRRKSKMKQAFRQQANKWRAPQFQSCPSCGATVPGHIACPSCGTYRGRKIFASATE
jgi:large subunit ribosomal protein L32